MRATKYMTEELMVKKAIRALIGELGPIEANRFLNMPRKKRIESVRRHREWQKSLNKEIFLVRYLVKKRKTSPGTKIGI